MKGYLCENSYCCISEMAVFIIIKMGKGSYMLVG